MSEETKPEPFTAWIEPKARLERWSRKDPKTGCWNWIGAKKGKGHLSYGHLQVGSRKDGTRRSTSAHRYSYEIYKGPIPPGMYVCHICDNPSCINPDHLFMGTPRDNVRDMQSKERNAGHKGSKHYFAKLTQEQVKEIRERYIPRVVTSHILAKEFGVSAGHIRTIVSNHSWIEVEVRAK